MAEMITLMWISGCCWVPGSLTNQPKGRWKDGCRCQERKKERAPLFYTGVPATPGWKWKKKCKCKKSGARRRKYRRTLMGGAPAVSLKNKGGCLEINVFISGWELKTQGGWRWGRPETDCVCWLGATPTERDERKPATVVDVTNSPLHFWWILWLTLSIFHLYWCPSKSDAFSFVFCVLSSDCCHPES